MDRQEIGHFNAISFNNESIMFIVYDDCSMSCPQLGIESFNKMWLKPRFELYGDKFRYEYRSKDDVKYQSSPALIAKYDINDSLFYFLLYNDMICYSQDMAYLYDFKCKRGFDSSSYWNGVGSPYKWAKKKGPILVKQRKGEFN